MAEQRCNFARNVKLYSRGLLPGCDVVLQLLDHDEKLSSCTGLDQLKRITSSKLNTEESKQAFLNAYSSWEDGRRECIKEITKLADNIDFHHRNINIAKVPTSAVGIGGAVLTITGLALIPVTFGASLALTISGAVVAVGATATGVTTAATDIGIRVNCLKKAKACADKHKQSTEEIFKLAQELANTCGEVEGMSALKDSAIELAGEATILSLLGLKNAASIGYTLTRTIPKASKSLHLLRNGFGLLAASSLRTVDVAADVAGSTTKVVTTTAGKVFIGLGFAFSAIGIVVDLVSAGMSIYDLAKGSKTSTSTKLREQAKNLQKELEVFKNLYEKLCE